MSDNKPLISSTRQTISETEMQVVEGTLPDDIFGYVFVNSSSGTVNSALPYPKEVNGKSNPEWGTSVLAGDGYVFRIAFNEGKQATFQAQLVTNASLAWDERTKKIPIACFNNWGISRISLLLGAREQMATAVQPVQFKGRNQQLLVTADLGRPYEIDGTNLNTLAPIGRAREYAGTNFVPFIPLPFPIIQTTAHPVFDPDSQSLFIANYTKSMATTLSLPQMLGVAFSLGIDALEKKVESLIEKNILAFIDEHEPHSPFWEKVTQELEQLIQSFVARQFQKSMEGAIDEVFVLSYSGTGDLQKWRVVDSDNQNIRIEQCIHQMGITQDYLLFSDSAFKLTPDVLFPIDNRLRNPIYYPFHRWLRQALTKPQESYTDLYIIRKADFVESSETVLAQKIRMTPEHVHFVTDYANPEGKITLYSANNAAGCLAEWVRYYDTLSNGKHATDDIIGLLSVGSMDVNRIGKAIIDVPSNAIESYVEYSSMGQIVDNEFVGQHTWVVGLPTYNNILSPSNPPEKINHIYWQCSGLDQSRLTEFIVELYKNYPNRSPDLTVEDILHYTAVGVPEQVGRLDTAKMEIVDYFQFPMGVNLHSVQFVPKRNLTEGISEEMNGYIFCMLIREVSSDNYAREIWLLDAADLSKGAVCVLTHPNFDYAFSLHSVWVESVTPRLLASRGVEDSEWRDILAEARKLYPDQIALLDELEKDMQ
jgi:carotenoid cleavage dioxygenase-like enzyme